MYDNMNVGDKTKVFTGGKDQMDTLEILDTAQYVIDKDGRQTAVLLDLESWEALRQLLEELAEDERLGELMAAVQMDEKLELEAAREVYQALLRERNE